MNSCELNVDFQVVASQLLPEPAPRAHVAHAAEPTKFTASDLTAPAVVPFKSKASVGSSEFVGCSKVNHGEAKVKRVIPLEISGNKEINDAICASLPRSHDFEVHRCIWKLRRAGAQHVGLQMPEGLQGWATALADLLCHFVESLHSATIFGEANFGACCIDDLGAAWRR